MAAVGRPRRVQATRAASVRARAGAAPLDGAYRLAGPVRRPGGGRPCSAPSPRRPIGRAGGRRGRGSAAAVLRSAPRGGNGGRAGAGASWPRTGLGSCRRAAGLKVTVIAQTNSPTVRPGSVERVLLDAPATPRRDGAAPRPAAAPGVGPHRLTRCSAPDALRPDDGPSRGVGASRLLPATARTGRAGGRHRRRHPSKPTRASCAPGSRPRRGTVVQLWAPARTDAMFLRVLPGAEPRNGPAAAQRGRGPACRAHPESAENALGRLRPARDAARRCTSRMAARRRDDNHSAEPHDRVPCGGDARRQRFPRTAH